MADDYEILTMKEICDLLKVHPSTVYKLVKQGEIPAFRIGSEWRFRRDTMLRLLSEKSNVSRVKKVSKAGMIKFDRGIGFGCLEI